MPYACTWLQTPQETAHRAARPGRGAKQPATSGDWPTARQEPQPSTPHRRSGHPSPSWLS
eukprot:31433_6